MNLPDSSSDFKPSKLTEQFAKEGTRPSISSHPRSKQSKKDQDLPIKLQVASALATNGYYARINVGLSATTSKGLADVTDVDVLATRYDITFSPESIAISCKSGESKGLSPAKEVFYLRGVLDYLRATNGIVAFSRKAIHSHQRDLGRRLSVLLLSGSEVETWCSSLTTGLTDPGYFRENAYDAYLDAWARGDTGGLAEYLLADYWFYFDFRNLQNIVGHLRKMAKRMTRERPWHSIIMFDTAAHLCLTMFDLCREIRLLGVSAVSETTAAYLFGGAPTFRARRDLYNRVQQLLASTGVLSPSGPGLPPLEPQYTSQLAELAVRFIDRPQAAVLIPQILQDALWRALGAPGLPPREDSNILAGEKLSQDLLNFLKVSSGIPWVPTL
jgi:hypothetical protein